MSPLSILATSCVPPGIRGALNQWMLEVLPGVFVGRPSARIRDQLWDALSMALLGQPGTYAAWITHAETEQGFTIKRVGDHRYSVEDYAGLQLITVRHSQRENSKADPQELLGFTPPF